MTLDLGFWVEVLASITTVAATYAYGNRTIWGPVLGVVCQFPWWYLMYYKGLWGLLPLNTILVVVHIRNTIKWKS